MAARKYLVNDGSLYAKGHTAFAGKFTEPIMLAVRQFLGLSEEDNLPCCFIVGDKRCSNFTSVDGYGMLEFAVDEEEAGIGMTAEQNCFMSCCEHVDRNVLKRLISMHIDSDASPMSMSDSPYAEHLWVEQPDTLDWLRTCYARTSPLPAPKKHAKQRKSMAEHAQFVSSRIIKSEDYASRQLVFDLEGEEIEFGSHQYVSSKAVGEALVEAFGTREDPEHRSKKSRASGPKPGKKPVSGKAPTTTSDAAEDDDSKKKRKDRWLKDCKRGFAEADPDKTPADLLKAANDTWKKLSVEDQKASSKIRSPSKQTASPEKAKSPAKSPARRLAEAMAKDADRRRRAKAEGSPSPSKPKAGPSKSKG